MTNSFVDLTVNVSFTVELCESVQVQTIEIGSLELFSSLPQSFEVHVSERFVTTLYSLYSGHFTV